MLKVKHFQIKKMTKMILDGINF